MKARANAAAAALIAILGEQDGYRLERGELQARLDLSSYLFGQALARARLGSYVTVRDGVVELTSSGMAAAAAGREGLNRDERRALSRNAR